MTPRPELVPRNASYSETNNELDAIEQCLSVADIAGKLRISPRSVRRLFADEDGVLWLGHPTLVKGHGYKRRYFTLTVPVSVFNRVKDRLQKEKPRPSLAPRPPKPRQGSARKPRQRRRAG
jgi:hypothetical protein